MKEWADKIDAGGKFGICTVREHTDEEVTAAHEQGLNYAHCDGFVNLFHGEKFVGWCGKAWAENRVIINPEMPNIDLSKPIRFFDDRGKVKEQMYLREILFSNTALCLCKASYDDQVDEFNVLFSLKTGHCESTEFAYWIAENF